MKVRCDTRKECGTPCGHALPHQATREFDRSGVDCDRQHPCPGGYGIVRCNPVEEPAKPKLTHIELVGRADFVARVETSGAVTIVKDRFHSLTMYMTPTAFCELAETYHSIVRENNHIYIIWNDKPRLCPSCGADLEAWAETLGGPCCEDGKSLTELAHARDMAQRKVWHAFRHGIPATMTPAVWRESVRAIITDVLRDWTKGRQGWFDQLAITDIATARIVALPRVRNETEGGE